MTSSDQQDPSNTTTTAANATDLTVATFIPLNEHTLIRVEGPDARRFLQGQCTCDFDRLDTQQLLLGAHCNPKGRMISSFIACALDDTTVALRVHKSIAEVALKALQKYAVFSKITLTIDEHYQIFGIVNGTQTPGLNDLPPVGEFSQQGAQLTLRHTHSLSELWVPLDQSSAMLKTLQTSHAMGTQNLWELANIQRGLGEISDPAVEQFLPQDLNFQLTDGVSFKKGCYTGQEIVARLHYRATLKKHMYRGQYTLNENTANIVKTGTSIIDINTGKTKGQVINVAKSNDAHYEILALCDDELVTHDNAGLDQHSTLKIQWLPLPYAIN